MRAGKAGGANHFAIGVPTAAPAADTRQFVGDVAGHWSLVQLAPSGYAWASSVGVAGFGPLGPSAALQPVDDGPVGLLRFARASDAATVFVAGSQVMAVQIGAPGELDLLALIGAP